MLIIFMCVLNLKLCVVYDSGERGMSNGFPGSVNEVQLHIDIIRPVMAVKHQLDEVEVSSYMNKQFVSEVTTKNFIYFGYICITFGTVLKETDLLNMFTCTENITLTPNRECTFFQRRT
jgi:hypothetical protein